MKKRYNAKKTFTITGIIQAVFLFLYLVPIIYASLLWSQGLAVSLEIWKLVRNFFLLPVAPICFIVNCIGLVFLRNETSILGKIEYILLFLSEIFFMSVAWFFLSCLSTVTQPPQQLLHLPHSISRYLLVMLRQVSVPTTSTAHGQRK